MFSRRTVLMGAAAGAVIGATVPTAALATPVAAISQPCYSHAYPGGSQPAVITLTGGIPNARFLVAASYPGYAPGSGTAGSTTGTFDAAGNATATIENLSPRKSGIEPVKGETVTFTVQEYTPENPSPAPVVIGTTLITNAAIDVSTTPRQPNRPRRIAVSGSAFANQKLTGFVVRGKGSRVLRKIQLGKGDICGYVSRKAVVAPRNYSTGTYTLYVNPGGKLNKSKALAYSFRIYRF